MKYPYISKWPDSLKSNFWEHGATILSKYPMDVFYHQKKEYAFSLIDFPDDVSVIVINTHLVPRQSDYERRNIQFK